MWIETTCSVNKIDITEKTDNQGECDECGPGVYGLRVNLEALGNLT